MGSVEQVCLPAACDTSVQSLFCELVSQRLAPHAMDSEFWETEVEDVFAPLDSCFLDHVSPRPSDASHIRLLRLEKDNLHLFALLKSVVDSTRRLELQVASVAASLASPSSNGSSPSSSQSPSAVYCCPFCLGRQKSPKAHVEHLHNVLKKKSSSICRINPSIARHDAILELFNNDLDQFVSWYCGHLRCSHDVAAVTTQDVADYLELSSQLETAIVNGSLSNIASKFDN